ncbi:MAG: DUF4349 domain-containing protein [Bacteroidota bacterium]|nr:DUF4349 domain-containing protein [Bacteroidota bacterium]
MKSWNSILLALLAATVLSACSSDKKEPPSSVRIFKYSDLGHPSSNPTGDQNAVEVKPYQRMIILTANLQIEVANCNTTLSKIQNLASQNNGYVVRSTTTLEPEGTAAGNALLRIPSHAFDTTLSEIKSIAKTVESQTVEGNDVTAEFYDVSARLENKQKVEARFREILKSAKSVKDILDVEQALGNVREDIERLTGRKKYLADQVQYSTISVYLHEPYKGIIAQEPSFISKIENGIQKGVVGFEDVMSFLVTILIAGGPVILAAGVVAFYGLKIVKRRRNKRNMT